MIESTATVLWDAIRGKEDFFVRMVSDSVYESLCQLGDDVYSLDWATVSPLAYDYAKAA